MNGWLLALLGLGGAAAVYLATRPKTMDATMPFSPPNYVPSVSGLVKTPAWAMTPAGQAWAVANEQNNIVNPPGTPGWYAWQKANPAPTNAAPNYVPITITNAPTGFSNAVFSARQSV